VNGAHDLGGMQGFGPVTQEPNEARFHDDWERRVLAVTLAMGATGTWNLDMTRAARESLPPQRYLSCTYYRIWLEGLLKLLVKTGLATPEETDSGRMLAPAAPEVRTLMADQVAAALAKGSPTLRKATVPAQFEVGDAVRTRQMNPPTHTRLPRYCRGRHGTIVAVHGAHVFPDTHATGQGEQPRWLYTVRFDATELWGADTTASAVCVDCWEPYLEAP